MIYWKGIDLFLQFPFSLVNFLAIFDNFSKYILLAKKYFTYNHLPLFLHIFMIKIVMCSMKLVRFYNFWNLTLKNRLQITIEIIQNFLLYTCFSLFSALKNREIEYHCYIFQKISWNWKTEIAFNINIEYITRSFKSSCCTVLLTSSDDMSTIQRTHFLCTGFLSCSTLQPKCKKCLDYLHLNWIPIGRMKFSIFTLRCRTYKGVKKWKK